MNATLKALADRIAREPVLFFGALGLWAAVAFEIKPDTPAGVALAASVLFAQRAFSTSKRTDAENTEVGKWVGALEAQLTPPEPAADPQGFFGWPAEDTRIDARPLHADGAPGAFD